MKSRDSSTEPAVTVGVFLLAALMGATVHHLLGAFNVSDELQNGRRRRMLHGHDLGLIIVASSLLFKGQARYAVAGFGAGMAADDVAIHLSSHKAIIPLSLKGQHLSRRAQLVKVRSW